MEVDSYGPRAVQLRFAWRADEAAFACGQALRKRWEARADSLDSSRLELISGLTTLVWTGEPTDLAVVRAWLADLPQDLGSVAEAMQERCVEIPTRYDGADLDRVAALHDLSAAEVIQRHGAPLYRVQCLGFSPGFPYLGGLDPSLATPRLATPRTRVPAGSVAIGGEQTGIYSVASPGGWNLIGSTTAPLFRPRATSVEAAFLLRAGDRLRFVPDDAPGSAPDEPGPRPTLGTPLLRILSPGLGLTLQDAGRPGMARFGVPPSGPLDRIAAGWANRLLENSESAPVLELCFQGQRFEVLRDSWLALTGGSPGLPGRPGWSAFRVKAGEVLNFPPATPGVWSYLAVPGGWCAEAGLGSVSTLPRAGLGEPWVAGSELRSPHPSPLILPSGTAGRRVHWTEVPDYSANEPLWVWPGPQWNSFTPEDRARFAAETWTLSNQCDRVGYRLTGPPLQPSPPEILSEPVLPGTVQVPPNGQPIVTLPDGPTVGGYPKLGWLDSEELRRLAQMRPGSPVRFRWRAG